MDIGGGTSDFTVFEAGHGGIEIVVSHGVRIGGDRQNGIEYVAHCRLIGLIPDNRAARGRRRQLPGVCVTDRKIKFVKKHLATLWGALRPVRAALDLVTFNGKPPTRGSGGFADHSKALLIRG